MTNYSGECQCGIIKFTCEGEPFFTQYCHCNKCREVFANSERAADLKGYAWTAGYLTKRFHITAGENNLEEMIRINAKLFLCKTCHTQIYGISLDPAKQAGVGINMNNFKFENTMPAAFNPVRHVWYQNRIIDFNDNLPKFKDTPKEQFGSGEIWSDDSTV